MFSHNEVSREVKDGNIVITHYMPLAFGDANPYRWEKVALLVGKSGATQGSASEIVLRVVVYIDGGICHDF